MAIRRMNYLSLSPARREKAAKTQLTRLREELVMNPGLTQDQKDAINARIAKLNQWICGEIDGVDAIEGGIETVTLS